MIEPGQETERDHQKTELKIIETINQISGALVAIITDMKAQVTGATAIALKII
jgi:hypothetical protein